MLTQTDKERLSVLEANIPWIKDAIARIELAEKERVKSLEKHLMKHPNGTGGVQIIIGRKALGLLATGPAGALIAWLHTQGVFTF